MKAEGSPVTIAHGIDDVCSKCPHMENDRCAYTEHSDEEIREMDKKALDLLKVTDGRDMIWNEIKEIMPEIFRSWHESYCVACGWRKACEKNDSFRQLSCLLTP